MRERMKYYCSLLPVKKLTRGLIALGAFTTAFALNVSVLKVSAMEMEPIEQIEEELEEQENVIDDDTGSLVVGDSDMLSDGEAGQIDEEIEVSSESGQTGCACGEKLIEFYQTQMIESQDLTQYESIEEFEATPAQVNRYEYEILKRLEFMQYTQLILIGLIFILIFKKK